MNSVREFFIKLGRVFSGIKLLWNNSDWDYYYLLQLIRWKLKRMHNVIKYSHHLHADEDTKDIKIAINLLDRISSSNSYIGEAYSKALTEWWEGRIEIEDNNLIRIEFPKDKSLNKQLDMFAKRAQDQEEQDWELLFKVLKTKMRCWWS